MATQKKEKKPKKARGRPVDRSISESLLSTAFEAAEEEHRTDAPKSDFPSEITLATQRLFASATQAYRDALPSCVIARIVDDEIDIRLPATEYGANAFSGRSLSENVVTPFLRARGVPTSATPFLSALRGGAKFIEGGAPRIQRDKDGFDAIVKIVTYLVENNADIAKLYLRYLMREFIVLRESNRISLQRIAKPNLEQLRCLIVGLLTVKSGGRIASMLAVAMFQTLAECYGLGWQIEFQGINVADKSSGAVGDITIRKDGIVVLGVEVTERTVDKGRVNWIFNEKVSPLSLPDYLFITTSKPDAAAFDAARNYTGVGHEMNFVQLSGWIVHNLATIGPKGRETFQAKMIDLINATGTPAEIKVAWNNKMNEAIGV